MSDLHHKVVFITGASSGIGEALARECAGRGAKLALVARRRDRLERLAQELKALGVEAEVYVADVTIEGDLERVAALAQQRFGSIDVVVANAGFGVVGLVEALAIEDYRRQFETNVYGVLRTVQATLDALKKSQGRLVLIGSVNGYVALPGSSPYAMSKFAVRALADALHHELKPVGIAVTHIAPGFVESEIRQVDNLGAWHEKAHDPVPEWLRVRREPAARQIVDGVVARRRELVITGHGKFAVWMHRHLPALVHVLIRVFGLKARSPR